jgi:WD40 repeat protein
MTLSLNRSLLAVACAGSGVWVWSLSQPQAAPTILRTPAANAVQFLPDGRLVCGGRGMCIASLDDSGAQIRCEVLDKELRTEFVAVSRDGSLAVQVERDGLLRVYDAGAGELRRMFPSYGARAWCAKFSPDGAKLISTAGDGKLQVAEVREPRSRLVYESRLGSYPSSNILFEPGGRQLFLAEGSEVKRVSLEDGRAETAIRLNQSYPVRYVTVAADPLVAAFAYEKGEDLCLATPQGPISYGCVDCRNYGGIDLHKTPDVPAYNSSAVLSSIADRAAYRFMNRISVRRVFWVPQFFEIQLPKILPSAMAFSGDAKTLAVFYDRRLSLYETDTGKVTFQGEPVEAAPVSMSWSANGKTLAVQGRHQTLIWDAERWGQPRRVVTPHSECAALSPDGATLAIGDAQGAITLYLTSNGSQTLTLSLSALKDDPAVGAVKALAFSPDGRTLASWSVTPGGTGRLFVWPTK